MAVSFRTFGIEFEMLVSLGEVFMDEEEQHQALAEHATDNFATTIGPLNPLYDQYML